MPVPSKSSALTSTCSRTGFLPAWLGLLMWPCLTVACWVVIGVALGARLFPALATDDYPRLVLSMQWARTPFLVTNDAYWLPLPYWIYGPWYALTGKGLGLFAHLPLSGGLVGLSAVLLMAVCRNLDTHDERQKTPRYSLAFWLAFALPFTIPILYFVATSGLSETVYLPSLALVMLAMTRLIGKPSRQGHLLLVMAAIVLQLSRYEGWPLSFAAVGLAQLMTWRRSSASPRQWLGWALSWLTLLIIPAAWMALNFEIHGSALHFLAQADEGARLDSILSTRGLGFRLNILLCHAIEQGWLILALAPAALPLMRKDRRILALGLFAAAAWALYFEAALANTIGVARTERFCLGPLWITLPLAVMGGQWLRAHMRRWPLSKIIFLLVSLAAFGLNHGFHTMLRKSFVNAPTYRYLLELRRSARTEALVVVIENPAKFVIPSANLFRFYLGLDAVAMLDWYDASHPVSGNFLFFPDLDNPNARAENVLLGRPCLKLSTMPPASFENHPVSFSSGDIVTQSLD